MDAAIKQTKENPGRCVLLYSDEVTFYRQPSQGWLWAYFGRKQPRMRYSNRNNTRMRVLGYFNMATGALHSEEMKSITVKRLARSVSKLSEWYPDAEKIYLVWDNWPNHSHPTVLEALERQERVEVVWLPTYSPWFNAIEKVWRWTSQKVTHAHPWSNDFVEFRKQVMSELKSFSEGSEILLRYAGLSK